MKKLLFIFASVFGLLTLTSCDDGRIYDEVVFDGEGIVVKLEGRVTGLGTWPTGYTVAIAGFDGTDDYAAISKMVSASTPDGQLDMQLAGVKGEVKSVELCVLNTLRQRVATFRTASVEGVRDTLRFDVGNVDVTPRAAIQTNLLDQSCIACHGATDRKGAGLDLTEGHFPASVVGVASQKLPDLKLVSPGDAENSVLRMVMRTDVSKDWRQNHADMLNKDRTSRLLDLVDEWINLGAE